jgi:uncharacterized protein
MPDAGFTHLIFWTHPIETFTFLALIMSFASLWIYRSVWLWGSFASLAYVLAYHARLVHPISLVPVATLMILHLTLKRTLKPFSRAVLILFATVISLGLWLHLFPGFNNWAISENLFLGKDAALYNFWLNFDKPFTGLFILAFALPLVHHKEEWKEMARKAIPLSLVGIAIILCLALYTGQVAWNPKVPTIFFAWMLNNLFLVSIPEEAFLRGFIQRELFQWMGKSVTASIGAVLFTAFFFTLLHLNWVQDIPFLSLIFATGIVYGAIYQYTQRIESSIICHFLLNAIHFTFFTYPYIAK